MMKPIRPEELSAYLDGELDAQRNREVEEALTQDAALRVAHDELKRTDILWRSAIQPAQFQPHVTALPSRATRLSSPLAILGLVCLLLLLRFLPKVEDIVVLGMALHVLALAIVLPWVSLMSRGDQANRARTST